MLETTLSLEEAIRQIPFLTTPPEVLKMVDQFLMQQGKHGYLNVKFEIFLLDRRVIVFMPPQEAAIIDDYFLRGTVIEGKTAALLYGLCCALGQKPATFLSM